MDNIEVCKLLLSSKVDPTTANRNGQLPRELISATNRDLVELFDGASE